MQPISKYLALFTGTLILFTGALQAQIPQQFTYQGVAEDNVGVPLPGPISLQIDIYVVGGSTALYTETHTSVTVDDGLFSVVVGSIDPGGNPLNLPFDDAYEFEVTLDGVTLSPRRPLTASPYSFNSLAVRGRSATDNLVPSTGDVGIGTTSPDQQLDVNGKLRISSGERNEGLLLEGFGANANSGGRIFFEEADADNAGFSIVYNGGNTGGEILNYPSNTFGISRHENNVTGTIALAIKRGSGNVGIGTDDPNAKLDVAGSIAVSGTVDDRDILADGTSQDNHLAATSAHGTTGAVVGTTDPQTLTNKTIDTASNTLLVSAADVSSGTFADARIAQSNVTQYEGSINHQNLVGTGTNTHAQIDAHIADIGNPHAVTKDQLGLSNVANLKNKLDATTAPTATDDAAAGYSVGSRWIDTVSDKEYVCADAANTAAVWAETTGGGSSGADNLGNHSATQNIQLGTNWLSGDGGNEGAFVDSGGDVGIGTTAPDQKLDVNGKLRISSGERNEGLLLEGFGDNANSGGRIFFEEAEANDFGFSIVYNGGDDNDILNYPNNTFGISRHNGGTNGSAGDIALAIKRTTGNVGIGTDIPNARLDVAGSIAVSGTVDGVDISSHVGDVAAHHARYTNAEALAAVGPHTTPDDLGSHSATTNLQLGSNWLSGDGDSEGISVDSDGNVGIDTTSPDQQLDVSGKLRIRSSQANEGLLLEGFGTDSNGGGRIFFEEADTNDFGFSIVYNGGNPPNSDFPGYPNNTFGISRHNGGANGSTGEIALAITRSDGNVGIGTSDPNAKLEVAGNATFDVPDGLGGTSGKFLISTPAGATGTVVYSQNGNRWDTQYFDDKLKIGRNPGTGINDTLVLKDNGNVGIGTTDPEFALEIKPTTSLQGNNLGSGIKLGRKLDTVNWHIFTENKVDQSDLLFNYNGTLKAWLNTAGTFTSGSDKRLKKNIEPLDNVLGKILQLQPVQYHFKDVSDGEPKSIGFIAQEVEEFFPELVDGGGSDEYKGLAYDNFAVLAIAAIKEQQKLIEKQQTELAEHKAGLLAAATERKAQADELAAAAVIIKTHTTEMQSVQTKLGAMQEMIDQLQELLAAKVTLEAAGSLAKAGE